eukprot:CAMPEP_0201557722 /NCGR_PEP_ID=MMETSP0173_2-20130828/63633_1 /ASSEMBLY_ACC=CAM_ASM_000268 /TAXON_ID=218659 /ORGANISM="Vexillifera sp., Strain DIVA3 564/2" /LENGTH=253 /DNA_ID=CAMNT_0047970741 /DNA_START=157 /DNA_END=918 /DNA_ORIENTATION=+
MASVTKPKVFRFQVVYYKNDNVIDQQVVHQKDYPEKLIHQVIDDTERRINDLFFAEDMWTLHITKQQKKVYNFAVRSEENWQDLQKEVDALGKEKWRIHSITWGTGTWTAILSRPVRGAKPTSWFGGSYEGAKKWLINKGPKYFVDYCTWVDEEADYFLTATEDPDKAAKQKIFFTQVFPLADKAVAEHLRTHAIVQLAGGPDGWIVVFGEPAEASIRTISASQKFPTQDIAAHQQKGLWVRCIRYVPDDAAQ